jgi:flagellar biosynthetic protein FliR
MIVFASGLSMPLVFSAVEMASHVVGLQMGMGFDTFSHPQNLSRTPIPIQVSER